MIIFVYSQYITGEVQDRKSTEGLLSYGKLGFSQNLAGRKQGTVTEWRRGQRLSSRVTG